MFAGLFAKIGMYLIIALVVLGIMVGGYAYIENEKAQIATLQGSISALQTSNTAQALQITSLLKDMALVKQAQDVATKAISNAATQAKLAQQTIRSQNLNKAAEQNSTQLTNQLNTMTSQTLSNWETISK